MQAESRQRSGNMALSLETLLSLFLCYDVLGKETDGWAAALEVEGIETVADLAELREDEFQGILQGAGCKCTIGQRLAVRRAMRRIVPDWNWNIVTNTTAAAPPSSAPSSARLGRAGSLGGNSNCSNQQPSITPRKSTQPVLRRHPTSSLKRPPKNSFLYRW